MAYLWFIVILFVALFVRLFEIICQIICRVFEIIFWIIPWLFAGYFSLFVDYLSVISSWDYSRIWVTPTATVTVITSVPQGPVTKSQWQRQWQRRQPEPGPATVPMTVITLPRAGAAACLAATWYHNWSKMLRSNSLSSNPRWAASWPACS